MRGCLALRPRNQSVVPGWQGIETCPECVAPTWRRLARKNQDVLILPACVRALGPLMIPALQLRQSFAQDIQQLRLMPLSAFPLPSKGEGKDGPA